MGRLVNSYIYTGNPSPIEERDSILTIHQLALDFYKNGGATRNR